MILSLLSPFFMRTESVDSFPTLETFSLFVFEFLYFCLIPLNFWFSGSVNLLELKWYVIPLDAELDCCRAGLVVLILDLDLFGGDLALLW